MAGFLKQITIIKVCTAIQKDIKWISSNIFQQLKMTAFFQYKVQKYTCNQALNARILKNKLCITFILQFSGI